MSVVSLVILLGNAAHVLGHAAAAGVLAPLDAVEVQVMIVGVTALMVGGLLHDDVAYHLHTDGGVATVDHLLPVALAVFHLMSMGTKAELGEESNCRAAVEYADHM